MTSQESTASGGVRRSRPDFNAMDRQQVLASFGDTVDRSDFTGKDDKRHPHKEISLHAIKQEVNAAISQIKGRESLDLPDLPGRRKSIVDSLRTFAQAARTDEQERVGKVNVPTGNILTGVAALDYVSAGFGASTARRIGFDRDAVKKIAASVPERLGLIDVVEGFRAAQGVSYNRVDQRKAIPAQQRDKGHSR